MVTTTVGMVHGVHGNTTSTRPANEKSELLSSSLRIWFVPVTLGPVFVVRPTSLEQRLVDASTACNDADRRTRTRRDRLLRTAGQADTSLVVLRGVTDDGRVVAGCTCEGATVTNFLLDVANNGTFGALAYRKDVANRESGLFAAVNKGASVKTFGSDKRFLAKLVAVRVAEDDTGKRCPADIEAV